MKLSSESFEEGARIPGEFAFAVMDAQTHVKLSGNRNPHLAWSEVPEGTRSFALICHDPEVPSRGDDVNREGREVPADLPRVDFFHWVLVDLPAQRRQIAAGEFSEGVMPRGKAGPQSIEGARQGINDYTGWFASDEQMSGQYFGYDGPCPPWNDARMHCYVFALYALAIARVNLEEAFTGVQVREAMGVHVLAQATLTGTYTLNPRLA